LWRLVLSQAKQLVQRSCKGDAMARPPKLATWLLKRFGEERTTEAILGDLTERFQAGKTRWWYWKQVVIAAVACARCDLQAYAFGAAIALITQIAAAVESLDRGRISFFPSLMSPTLIAAMIYFAVRIWRRNEKDPARIQHVLRRTAFMTAFVSAAFHIAFGLWWFRFSNTARIPGVAGVLTLALPAAAIGFISVYLLVIASGRLAMKGSGRIR
jgi:hypothetical protein